MSIRTGFRRASIVLSFPFFAAAILAFTVALYVWATAPTASIDPYARYLGDHPWDGLPNFWNRFYRHRNDNRAGRPGYTVDL